MCRMPAQALQSAHMPRHRCMCSILERASHWPLQSRWLYWAQHWELGQLPQLGVAQLQLLQLADM